MRAQAICTRAAQIFADLSYRTTSLRKVYSPLLLRSIIPLGLYRRIFLPSCCVATWLLRLPSFPLTRAHFATGQRRFDQRDLRRGSRLQVSSERSTRTIGQSHTLCALAALRLPAQRPPFFARMPMPSMQHASPRPCCWSESGSRNARHRWSSPSRSAHAVRRRWPALLAPSRAGHALQGAPVHPIHSMPSQHVRSSSRGRPPFRECLRGGTCCLRRAHGLFVTPRQAMDALLDLVSYDPKMTCQPV